MATTTIVLLFGSPVDAGRVSVLSSESSRLHTIIDEASGAVNIDLISFGPEKVVAGLRNVIHLKGKAESPIDASLRVLGAFALRRKFATFPLGRLLNSMGPVDPGRVFWRAVRRDSAAMEMIRCADVAIAADLPAAKTAWIALRKGFVDVAHYDPRSASLAGAIAKLPPTKTVPS